MNFPGMILILFFAVSGCNEIKVKVLSQGSIVSSGLTAETSPDGSGIVVDSITLEVGNNFTFYAIKRSPSGDFISNHAVSWSKNGTSGNLSIQGSGESSEFTPIAPGVTEVSINDNGKKIRTITITVVPAVNPPLNVSNLVISGITTTGFTATIDFTGGSPGQTHTLYYCNNTASPGCNPTAGTSTVMSVSGGTYTASITGLTNPGNVFNVRVITTDTVTVTGSPMSTTATLLYNDLTVSNLVISSITTTGFTATLDFTGGSPAQAHTLYYCNNTASPGCNPSAGSNISMNQSGAFYTVNVTGLTNPGDDYIVRAISTDSVSVSGSPLNTTTTLAYPGLSVSNLVVSGISTTGFTATIDFTGGSPAQTHTLYYCNNTVSPGCVPTAGTSAAMSVSGGTYTASVTGLTNPGNVFNVRVVSSDSVTVTGSPLNTTATLLYNDLAVSGLAISNITATGFRATINYTGGSPAQSHITYYCNETSSPGCDPLAGGSAVMINSGATYYANITGLVNPTNTFNVRVVSTDSVSVTGSPQNTTTTLLGTGITISGAVASNKTKTGMTITTNFTGDTENSASLVLWYCNATLTPGCVPTSGSSVAMTRSGPTYVGTIAGLSGPSFNEADNLNLRVIATDIHGVSGSPVNVSARLADFYPGALSTSNVDSVSFTASLNFTEDTNATGSVILYYCNETDSAGCNPLTGTAVPMNRSGSTYTVNVSGLGAPNDVGDVLNLLIVGSDPDGVYQSGTPTSSIRLVDVEVSNFTVIEISDKRFFSSVLVNNRDNNANTVATLYYCDETSSPGCNPMTGVSGAMAFASYPDRYVLYVDNHNIPVGHTVNAMTVISDVDNIYTPGQLGPSVELTTTFKIPNPTDIFRSIGPGQTSALHQGGAGSELTIIGSNVSFISPLSNQVGVGDAIFYDSDGNSLIDAVAFIHARTDNQNYIVKNVDGDTPTPATTQSKWKLYRAYNSLANAENGIENTGITTDVEIPAGLSNFDSWSGGKDISAQTGSDESWNFALYAGTQADTTKTVFSVAEWIKDRSNIIKIFTPNKSSEVGVTQRHSGIWDNTKYRLVVNNDTAIHINTTTTTVEGLQIELTGSINSRYGIYNYRNSEGKMVGNIIRSSSTGTSLNGIRLYSHAVQGDRWLWAFNNIIYNFTTASSAGFAVDASDQSGRGARLYNNTIFNNFNGFSGGGYRGHLFYNNIILGSLNTDFATGSDANALYNNLHGDNSISIFGTGNKADNITGHLPSAVFMDHDNGDFRLAPGSPAIGAGFDASTVITTDIIGNTRTPPFDIGAFQD